jgi:hypothetical protein
MTWRAGLPTFLPFNEWTQLESATGKKQTSRKLFVFGTNGEGSGPEKECFLLLFYESPYFSSPFNIERDLSPWSTLPPENLIVTQPANKLPRLLRNLKINYRVHKSHPLVPSWTRWMQFKHSFNFLLSFNVMLPSLLCTSLPRGSDFLAKILYPFLICHTGRCKLRPS